MAPPPLAEAIQKAEGLEALQGPQDGQGLKGFEGFEEIEAFCSDTFLAASSECFNPLIPLFRGCRPTAVCG